MIFHEAYNKSGNWGVSLNENGIILKVGSYRHGDRIVLCEEEVDHVIEELEQYKKEYKEKYKEEKKKEDGKK